MKKSIIMAALLFAFAQTYAANKVETMSNSNLVEAQNSIHVKGKVIDAKTGDPIPYANVLVVGSTMGATTNSDGSFSIDLPTRSGGKLRVSYVGYTSKTVSFSNRNNMLSVSLQPTSFNVDEVVVSANRSETLRRLAPVLVNVTDEKLFNATSSVNLDQALKFNPGIRVEDNCQNCGFNQVRINGLDGNYSQILINSRSVFSSLAGVYALEMLPTDMIERVEVVRGGGSALYGSSAIGGTINIITKAPTRNMTSVGYTSEFFQDNYDKPSHNVNFFSSVVSHDYKAGISIFGRMKHRSPIDIKRPGSKQKDELDGFSDLPRLFSSTVGASAFFNVSPDTRFSLDYFYTQENRRGGDNLDRPEHEANIAESLRHRIHTGIFKLDQFFNEGKGHLTAFVGASSTVRNSYYGGGPLTPAMLKKAFSSEEPAQLDGESDDEYKARVEKWENTPGKVMTNGELKEAAAALTAYGLTKQINVQSGLQYVYNFDKFLFMPSELTLGVEHKYDKLNDESGLRLQDIDQKINTTSLILQNEWKNDYVGLLLGMRYDHVGLNTGDKVESKDALTKLDIVTPRVTFRYNPTENLNFRLSYAEGFRAPAYFDEDLHVAFANGEGKPRVLAKDLKEERSKSVTASMDYYWTINDDWNLNLMCEGFYTRINDKFAPVEKGDVTYIENRDEDGKPVDANIYGVNLEGRLGYKNLVTMQFGFTIQKSQYTNPQEAVEKVEKTKDFMRTPDNYGYFVLTYKPAKHIGLNLSGDYTGKMKVPHEHGDINGNYIINSGDNMIVTSKSFFTLNTKLTYTFDIHSAELEFNLGINNIFNSFQNDFDEGPSRASAYIYGPKAPRMVFAGVKMNL